MKTAGIPHNPLALPGAARAAMLAIVGCIAGWTSACEPPKTYRTPSYSQRAYIKASSGNAGDRFGSSIALSANGSTLAVGAPLEDSDNPNNPTDRDAEESGAVYVFTTTTWDRAYIKASPISAGALFGSSVALSADGSILAVGAPEESPGNSGAVYVFSRRDDGEWMQQMPLATALDQNENFGTSVALSADGAILAVGAPGPGQTNAYPPEPGENDPGVVHVYRRSGTAWGSPVKVTATGLVMGNRFGYRVALSGNGSTLAVAACGACDGNPGIPDAGAVYVFTPGGSGWVQSGPPLHASNPEQKDLFGGSLALSDDGLTLAVGAQNVDDLDDPAGHVLTDSGAVYVFTRGGSPSTWNLPTPVKADTADMLDHFGQSVALSPDGQRLAVGAPWEDSKATGVDNDDVNNSATNSGAAYVFTRNGEAWDQSSYLKARNAAPDAQFGQSIALSRDGSVAVGAYKEAGAGTGVDPDPASGKSTDAGAAYVFETFRGPRQAAARAPGGDAAVRTASP